LALRIGVDLDGTLADLSTAYHDVAQKLFGDPRAIDDDEVIENSEEEQAQDEQGKLAAARQETQERDLIWQTIRRTEDFWLNLQPIEPGVIAQLNEQSLRERWEVFFITQRPSTAGQTVQRQSQQWLERQGFDRPSVLTLSGGRGRAAAALELSVLIDDLPKNCLDAVAESSCRPLLILRDAQNSAEVARRLGIEVVNSAAEAIAKINTPGVPSKPGLIKRFLRFGQA
jgi:hypothetical protein